MLQSSVKIIYHNENAHSIVASAGRISTTKGRSGEIYERSCQRDEKENINLIQKILSSGHTSVMEHAFVNLAFDNVSVFVEQFMIEFRLASFTVKSRRYVDFGKMGYIMPDFDGTAPQIRDEYQKHMEYLFEEYAYLLEQGVPKEDARFVLPYGFRSNFYCTVNARELVKIVTEMVWGRGSEYPEIEMLGRSLIRQCEDKLPFLQFRKPAVFSKEPLYAPDFAAQAAKLSDAPAETPELAVLLDGPAHPEEAICRAAVLESGVRNWRSVDVEDPSLQKTIIQNALFRSRKRELEQAHFTILFQHMSLSGVTHLVRHRMQSVVVPRYLSICDFETYIIPDSIRNAGLEARYRGIFKKTAELSQALRAAGFAECGQVYLLLSGLTIPVMTTMNANELFTFIRLRTCNRAQWEIRDNALALLRILREKYPVLFSLYGPMCYVSGVCPEGKATCGQSEEVKRIFTSGKF